MHERFALFCEWSGNMDGNRYGLTEDGICLIEETHNDRVADKGFPKMREPRKQVQQTDRSASNN